MLGGCVTVDSPFHDDQTLLGYSVPHVKRMFLAIHSEWERKKKQTEWIAKSDGHAEQNASDRNIIHQAIPILCPFLILTQLTTMAISVEGFLPGTGV